MEMKNYRYQKMCAEIRGKELGIGERLRLVRYEKGLSLDQVSEDVGIPATTIKRWEKNGDGAGAFLLSCLAQYYGVSMDYIVYGDTGVRLAKEKLEDSLIQLNSFIREVVMDRCKED